MTQLELDNILALEAKEAVKKLQVSSFDIPAWLDLEKEYDSSKHAIWDEIKYPKKLNENNQDDFKRTGLGLQKLTCDRLAQSMFATPVERVYDYDKASTSQQEAAAILEKIYRIENNIDTENIERSKKVNAACQSLTIWGVYDKEGFINGEPTKQKLYHRTYSPKTGHDIFAQTDDIGNLIVVSILYKDSSDVEHMDVYTTTQHLRFDKLEDWTLNTELSGAIDFMPCVYMYSDTPAWGGYQNTVLVEQLEEMESFQGMYIKKNAAPVFTQDFGEITNGNRLEVEEKSTDSKKVIELGKGGKMESLTWEGAVKATTERYFRVRNSYFEQTQTPDNSFATMLASNSSAENKDLLFADVKAKAIDVGGEWIKLFYDELNIVKEFAKVMFPRYANDFDMISVRSVIKPYSVKIKKDNAEYVANAGSAMSLDTKIRVLGEVDDIEQEILMIQEENASNANQNL